MNSFEKLTDLVLAVICMFFIPFFCFDTEAMELAKTDALQDSGIFLEKLADSKILTRESFFEFCIDRKGGYAGDFCEIEIIRTLADGAYKSTLQTALSHSEIMRLLNQHDELPLKNGDYMTVTVYKKDKVSGNTIMLCKSGRYL